MRSIISAFGVAFISSYSSVGVSGKALPMVENQNFQSIPLTSNQSDGLQFYGASPGFSGAVVNSQRPQNLSTIPGDGIHQGNPKFLSAMPSSSNGARVPGTSGFPQGLNNSFANPGADVIMPNVVTVRCSQAYMPLSVQDLRSFDAPEGDTPSAGDPSNTTVRGGSDTSNRLRERALAPNMGQTSLESPLPLSVGTSGNETSGAVQVACKAMNDPSGAFCNPVSCQRFMSTSKSMLCFMRRK